MKKFKNLSNTTWQIFDNPGVMGAGVNVFKVTFDSNGDRYTEIKFVDEGNKGKLYYEDTYVATYPDGDWEDEKFQEIAIDGGEDVANPMLISWLDKYARCETAGAQTQDIVKAINSLADAVRGGGGGGGGGSSFNTVPLYISIYNQYQDEGNITVRYLGIVDGQTQVIEKVISGLVEDMQLIEPCFDGLSAVVLVDGGQDFDIKKVESNHTYCEQIGSNSAPKGFVWLSEEGTTVEDAPAATITIRPAQ